MTAPLSTGPSDAAVLGEPKGPPARAARPFGWRDRIGYMFGDFGNDFTFILQSTFWGYPRGVDTR